jgi:hypothetical protein
VRTRKISAFGRTAVGIFLISQLATSQMTPASAADFTFQQSGGAAAKTIAYDQVRSVSQLQASHTKVKWIVIGVVAAAAVFGIALAIDARCGPLGCGHKTI